MLASLSADQSQLTLVSLPRDTVDVPLADGGTWPEKINGLYSEGGIDELVGAMETLFGVPIDAHFVLDMDDFAALVDAAGGVEVSPPDPLVDPKRGPRSPGRRPGARRRSTTLGYVRTRRRPGLRPDGPAAGGAGRARAQARRPGDRPRPGRGAGFPRLAGDRSAASSDLPTWLELARRATDAEVHNLLIQPPLITFEGDRGDGRGYILEADVEAIRAEVQELIGD